MLSKLRTLRALWFNKLFAGCEMINCSIDILGVCSNCRKILNHNSDEETDLCAMLNKMSMVRYKYTGII